MSTFALRLPDSLYAHARKLAEQDQASLNQFITVVAIIVGVVQLVFVWNLIWSAFRGRKAEPNPWRAASLEWATPHTPPRHGNWGPQPPVVHRWAYAYSVPGAAQDFIAQDAPAQAGGQEPEAPASPAKPWCGMRPTKHSFACGRRSARPMSASARCWSASTA